MEVYVQVYMHGSVCASVYRCICMEVVVNCFLLKCRKLRREDQEKSDWISRILLLRPQAVGICSHRNLILSNFYRVLIGRIGGGTFGG